ncbi:AhpC-TSA-domain-containing protein [Fomitiporia mediterranea MF3/22]|uniref:AhpC-TSA-domain-containing protein n=1 Tax=Fomitiporia mediterranea (strain MF3/22) TaxID=694068 RepID=UPI0004409AF2|nr:AhpC-TSA-domain-containing protein [Fomitiporia mediterranea MF3/22]EJD08477.1 AhpC-TSA-domain-containing protein [Fomitiporia mediterranea MF3/22]
MASTELGNIQDTKMVVDEPQTTEETGPRVQEKETVAPRRSSRISATTGPTSNGAANKAKPAPKATKKRSVHDLADSEAGDAKESTKKAKTAEEDEGMKLGESLPDLVLKNEEDAEVKVQELAAGKKGVVLFLVPKADTPGCTTQACGFRDINADFVTAEFAVYCVSADTPDKQKKWKDKKTLPFPLLSDAERSLIEKLTGSAKKTARSHFVFAGDKLVDKRMPVKPADSPRLALEFIRALETGNTSTLEKIEAPDAADVAAASAAATVAAEQPPQDTVPTDVAPANTTGDSTITGEAAQAPAAA